MKIKINNFQIIFLTMYILFNTYAFFYILNRQETFGDFFEPINSDYLVYIAYFLTIFPFLFFGFFLYPFFQNKIEKNTIRVENFILENKIAIFIFVLQVFFMIFNLLTGVNSAGSGIKTDSLFKYIFIVLSPDILFFILYGFARDSKYFKYNLLIYLISSLQRGWMGGLFFIAVMELYIYYKKYGISKRLVFISSTILAVLILLLPYIVMLKWEARIYFGGNSSDDFLTVIQTIASLGGNSYFEVFLESLSYLFGRFQILSNVYLLLEYLDILQVAKENSEFISAFAIGLPQMLFYKIFGLDYTLLNSYFVSVIDTKVVLEDLTYNTHIGYVGLLLTEPYKIFLLFIYTVFLIYLVAFFSYKIGGKYIHFVSWFFLIIYLLQGWLAAYFSYLLGLIVFYMIKIIFKKIKFINRKQKCVE